MRPRAAQLAAALALVTLVAAAGAARAQGFVSLHVGGGLDQRLSGSLDARVGLFRNFKLQAGVNVGLMRGHPGPVDAMGARDGDYTLGQFTLAFSPYLGLGKHVGIGAHAGVGVGGLAAPARANERETKVALSAELGGAFFVWAASVLGFAVSADYRILYVPSPFDGFPSSTNDVVVRLWLVIALTEH